MKKTTGITRLEGCRFKFRCCPGLDVPFAVGRMILLALLILSMAKYPADGRAAETSRWEGVDKTVIEKVAEEAGRPPQGSLLPTDQGDLPLLMFLLAGTVGGFVAGYAFRSVFPPKTVAVAAAGVSESGKLP